ncbi:MAG: hypothetical protein C0623_02355 [Desulfuromonas sp.]|nr:MAG: hypothetical protein C0623_02355 [Desulfuromonas sp.]
MDLARQLREFWKRFDKGWIPGAVLSAVVFVLICYDYARDGQLNPDAFIRSAVVAGLLFFVFAAVIGSLIHDTLVEILQYGAREEHEPDDWVAICVFVVIKTLVRCTVGVVLVLGWLGGVVLIMETTSDLGIVGPVLISFIYSLLAFWVSYKFVVFMDRIHFPTDLQD